jgi:hypothetical protein
LAAGFSVKLMKPAPAIFGLGQPAAKRAVRAPAAAATSRGLRFSGFASCSARLLAKSPWAGLLGPLEHDRRIEGIGGDAFECGAQQFGDVGANILSHETKWNVKCVAKVRKRRLYALPTGRESSQMGGFSGIFRRDDLSTSFAKAAARSNTCPGSNDCRQHSALLATCTSLGDCHVDLD